VYKGIREKYEKHLYDMSYKNKAYVLDLWNILKKQGNKIIIAEDTYPSPSTKDNKSSYFLFFFNLSEASDTGSILLFAYSISSRKEEVCALIAAISIILPTISVVTSGTSYIRTKRTKKL
jgi:hypothetical protein